MTADTPRQFPPAAPPPLYDATAAVVDVGPLPADVHARGGFLSAVRQVAPQELTAEYPQELPTGRGHAGDAFPIGLARRHPRVAPVCGQLHPEGIWCRRESGHPGEHCGWAFGVLEVSVWNTPEPPAPDWQGGQ